ncbi:MAG TPA: iron chelate uptake ABC transporter family permease subunit, partial [Microbacteriaceae bacterium]|nr:iron chelate uptake ABC transporter family permease subunit [Microbacteriaceae bacterium]
MVPILAVAAAAAFLACCLIGQYAVSLPDFFRVLAGADLPGTSFIVLDDRLPKAATAVLVGGCLGVSGTLFQTMLHNPLASPDIIGISFGASASAVVAIVVFGLSGLPVSIVAGLGALGVAALIHTLSRGSLVYDHRLILIGIGVAAVLQAIVSFLLTRADISTASDALLWLTGSLDNSTWGGVAQVGVAAAVLLPVAWALPRPLGILGLGD